MRNPSYLKSCRSCWYVKIWVLISAINWDISYPGQTQVSIGLHYVRFFHNLVDRCYFGLTWSFHHSTNGFPQICCFLLLLNVVQQQKYCSMMKPGQKPLLIQIVICPSSPALLHPLLGPPTHQLTNLRTITFLYRSSTFKYLQVSLYAECSNIWISCLWGLSPRNIPLDCLVPPMY